MRRGKVCCAYTAKIGGPLRYLCFSLTTYSEKHSGLRTAGGRSEPRRPQGREIFGLIIFGLIIFGGLLLYEGRCASLAQRSSNFGADLPLPPKIGGRGRSAGEAKISYATVLLLPRISFYLCRRSRYTYN